MEEKKTSIGDDICNVLAKIAEAYVQKMCIKHPWINTLLTCIGGAIIAWFLSMVCGCHFDVPYTPPEYTNQEIAAVLVGVQSSYMGENTGTEEDIQYMQKLLEPVTDNIVTLREIRATKKNIMDAMSKAVQKPFSIIYFSAFAGREKTKVDEWEVDKRDEYIILQDDTIDDNEIWSIIGQSTNRVMCIFECPNSETMYRECNMLERFMVRVKRDPESNNGLNLLVWSACADDKYSTYTSNLKGHAFTRAIYYYSNVLSFATYGEVWDCIVQSKMLNYGSTYSYQEPKKTIVGEGFEDYKLFQ